MKEHDPDTTQRTLLSPGPALPDAGTACIVVIHGEGLGKRVSIAEKPVLIGRDHAADLSILHPSVSRRHCQVWRENDRYRVRDLGSTNTTRLGDRVIEVADLNDGDLLIVGESILKFIGGSNVEGRYHEEIHLLANRDELTGFYNRRRFIEIFDQELDRVNRDNSPLALAILDIDLFKRINDTFGHLTGDQVIRQVARCIHGHKRPQDTAGRIGGEEFALLLPGLSPEAARDHLDALRDVIQNATHSVANLQEPVTISIGLAIHNALYPNRVSLMKAADQALYRAKQTGRNRVISADECTLIE